jgi:hypothetical protein
VGACGQFARKRNVAVWRGSTTGADSGYVPTSIDTLLQLPRFRLALLSLQHPEQLDAKITKVVQVRFGDLERLFIRSIHTTQQQL